MKRRLLIVIPLFCGLVFLTGLKLFSQNDDNSFLNEPKGDYLGSVSNKAVQSTRNVEAENI